MNSTIDMNLNYVKTNRTAGASVIYISCIDARNRMRMKIESKYSVHDDSK